MKINHVIQTLVMSDFLFNAGFSFFGPIFAVFITGQIDGGTIKVVGYAAAITQIFKVGFQIPVARFLDRNHGEYDDFYSLMTGTIISACVPFLYLFASRPLHIYIIQAIYGIGLAMAVPPWFAIFTRHIDKMKENIEWSFESVSIGISGATAAAIGGIVAQRVGFPSVFIVAGCMSLFGAFFISRIFRDLKAHVSRGQVKPEPDRS
ncbi:MAG: MFS transporter [Candidatus Yanofskybacteria bacterium]|nr:MFS transporter [Candidatus Yanofskybacteria bacterium]